METCKRCNQKLIVPSWKYCEPCGDEVAREKKKVQYKRYKKLKKEKMKLEAHTKQEALKVLRYEVDQIVAETYYQWKADSRFNPSIIYKYVKKETV